jgi:hypothetical protein
VQKQEEAHMTLTTHSQKGKTKITEINKKMKREQNDIYEQQKKHTRHHGLTQKYLQMKKHKNP